MMFPQGLTVTVVRPADLDAYGDPSGEPTEHDLEGVALAPRVGGPGTASADLEDRGREGVRAGLTLYAEVGADIVRTDLVRIDLAGFEGLYRVDGDPAPWVSPFDGWEAGVEVALSRGEG